MFFAVLCILLWALIAAQVPFDTFGWLMLVALAWFLGFLDGQRAKRPRPGSDSPMPPDDPVGSL